jgi:small nuclear ribonucleoprotein (snRNP)-like protein
MSLFHSVFKVLCEKKAAVVVELKNGVRVAGTAEAVDIHLSLRVNGAIVTGPDGTPLPHFEGIPRVFIRSSAVRIIRLDPDCLDLPTLEDATRRDARARTSVIA